MAAIVEWDTTQVRAIWLDQQGIRVGGKWVATVPVRLRSASGAKRIIRAGVVASGVLNTTDLGQPSLLFAAPCNDDPDLGLTTPEWRVQLVVTFDGTGSETYYLDTPISSIAQGIDLHDIEPDSANVVPVTKASVGLGLPGGVALLSSDGLSVVDAAGNPIAATASWDTLSGKPAVIGSGATQAAARTSLGLGTAATADTTDFATSTQGSKADTAVQPTRTVAGKPLSADVSLTKIDVGLSNVDNTSDTAKPISSATSTALAGKANSSHAHVAADVGDSTTVGRSVLTASTAAVARTALGLAAVAASGSAGDLTGDPLPDGLLSDAATAGMKWNGTTFVSGRVTLYVGGSDASPPVGLAAGDVWIREVP